MTSSIQLGYDFMPLEVQEVIAYSYVKYVGRETMERINTIIDKYPEWFPWEHKYKSIPKEVHDAYYKEKYPNPDFKPLVKGIYEQMKEQPRETTFTINSLREIFNRLFDDDNEKALLRQYKKQQDKELWDKHYSKYNLEYRE